MESSDSDSLPDLIQRGRDISVSTQYGVHVGSESDAKIEVPIRFMKWRDETRSWLARNGFQDEAEFFDEADEVPLLLIGGYAFGDPASPESRKRMEQVRIAVSTKLKVLRTVRASLAATSPVDVNSKIPIRISRIKGLYRDDHPTMRYGVSGHRLEYLIQLLSWEQPYGLTRGNTKVSAASISRDIKDMNRISIQKLNLPKKLIDHSDSSGYFLNEDAYKITEEAISTRVAID